jgi:microcystin-dependent protein
MINETTIAQQIQELLTKMSQVTGDPETAQQDFAADLATIIATAVRSATVTLAPSTVNVVGTSGPSTNPQPIIGSLS